MNHYARSKVLRNCIKSSNTKLQFTQNLTIWITFVSFLAPIVQCTHKIFIVLLSSMLYIEYQFFRCKQMPWSNHILGIKASNTKLKFVQQILHFELYLYHFWRILYTQNVYRLFIFNVVYWVPFFRCKQMAWSNHISWQ